VEFYQNVNITQSVLKVVHNSLFHPYLTYSIINWRRASKETFSLSSNFKINL